MRDKNFSLAAIHDVTKDRSRVDLPRMEIGGLDAVFFAVFTGQGKRTPEAHKSVKEKAVEIFKTIHSHVEAWPGLVEIAYNSDDVKRIADSGKKVFCIGIENGYPIGDDINKVSKFYEYGARYITLCHTKNNDICDSANDEEEFGGVSEFGKKVIAEMNRLGIMIDVSHISDKSFFDVIKYSKAPVIASHSGARALCDNPRNMSDEMIKTLAANGGTIQIVLMSDYLKTPVPNPERDSARTTVFSKYGEYSDLSDNEREQLHNELSEIDKKFPRKLASVKDAVDHIDHVVKLAGIDHVGIGSDFDGGGGIDGCQDAGDMGNITFELLSRGYSKEDIEKIWSGNLLRVWKAAENTAANE